MNVTKKGNSGTVSVSAQSEGGKKSVSAASNDSSPDRREEKSTSLSLEKK
jgi:hypothetical protein